MTTTSFVNNVTQSDASWANDVDTATYSHLTGVAGTNTVTATGPASASAYAAGQRFEFIPANTNTGATTLNITCNSVALGAKNVFAGGAALKGGEIRASQPVIVVYDGTQFNILGAVGGTTFTPSITFGGAAVGVAYTTQLGAYKVLPGGLVWFKIAITLSSKGSSTGSLSVNGLPLTSANDSMAPAVPVRLAGSLGSIAVCQGYVNSNTTTISIEKLVAGSATILADTDLGNTSQIYISGFYST